MKYSDGDSYKRQWQNDKWHGQGVSRYGNGSGYEGGWQQGKQHGQGVYKYSNGNIEQGRWEKDTRQGPFTVTKKDGTQYEYVYKEYKVY
jgi:hypothetical protein